MLPELGKVMGYYYFIFPLELTCFIHVYIILPWGKWESKP